MKRRTDELYSKTGIYGVVNTVSGMVYIGQTLRDFGDRRDSHFSLLRNGRHPCRKMQEDFSAVGEDNFKFIVLCECGEADIDAKEAEYIALYIGKNLSYNKCSGGRIGYKGVPVSDHAKKIIGEKNRRNMLGRQASADTREKMSNSRRGKTLGPQSQQCKDKLSISHSGERSVLAKLTEEQVIEIRRIRKEEGLSYTELGRRFGVTSQCISDICKYKRWKYTD